MKENMTLDLDNGYTLHTTKRFIVIFENGTYLSTTTPNFASESLDDAHVFLDHDEVYEYVESIPQLADIEGAVISSVSVDLVIRNKITEPNTTKLRLVK